MVDETRKPNLTLVRDTPSEGVMVNDGESMESDDNGATDEMPADVTPWSTYLDGERQILKSLHSDMRFLVKGLPGAALNWQPGLSTNSLWALTLHTLGTSLHLLAAAADIEPRWQEWKRAQELTANGDDPNLLLTAIGNMDDFLDKVFPVLEEEDPAAERDWLGKPRPVSWLVAHAVEHAGRHVGHMELTRQLSDQRQKRR